MDKKVQRTVETPKEEAKRQIKTQMMKIGDENSPSK